MPNPRFAVGENESFTFDKKESWFKLLFMLVNHALKNFYKVFALGTVGSAPFFFYPLSLWSQNNMPCLVTKKHLSKHYYNDRGL